MTDTNLEYYCPECDIHINQNEIMNNRCPFCDTIIPEAEEEEEEEEEA